MRGIGAWLVLGCVTLVPVNLMAGDMSGYTTVMRVEFVLECMRDHPGSQYELMNKCSCVLDQLGKRYTAEAISISGERGSVLRDNEQAHRLASQYRDSLAEAELDCFLRPPTEKEQN